MQIDDYRESLSDFFDSKHAIADIVVSNKHSDYYWTVEVKKLRAWQSVVENVCKRKFEMPGHCLVK